MIRYLAIAASVLAIVPATLANARNNAGNSKPNFIFIMADDQDLHLDSLNYMPAVQKHFGEGGTFHEKHYCTVSQCCPSRVSLLTGKAAHNTNVTAVTSPYGGYPKFVSEGWNDHYLPVWLQAAGYNTYYAGKLMNGHSTSNYNKPFPKGWNSTNFLIDPDTYLYFNSTSQKDKEAPRSNPGVYSTDMIGENAIEFLDDAARSDRPFFIGVAPIGPHAELVRRTKPDGSESLGFFPAVPAKRHENLFPGLKVPRTPNFNPDKASGGGWIKTLKRMNETAIASADNEYRQRVLALQAVDDLVEDIFQWLETHPDQMQNTYIIYTSDNGFHIGQHRLPAGKTCNIEEDIHIPFFIRGPGVGRGEVFGGTTSHTDIVPTLFKLAGIEPPHEFDGEAMPLFGSDCDDGDDDGIRSEHINVEYWGYGGLEGFIGTDGEGVIPNPRYFTGGSVQGANNTYKTVRVIGEEYNLMYTVWCTNEHELYEMNASFARIRPQPKRIALLTHEKIQTDPYQLHNLYGEKAEIYGWDPQRLQQRLDTLVLTLKRCSGVVCTRPWAKLHPDGNVRNLGDAMHPCYDAFYEAQPRVSFSGCAAGQLLEFEGPLEPVVFG